MYPVAHMAVSFVSLFALAGLAAVVFLAVLGLIALLTNPRTRDVAKVLLGGLAALVLLVLLVGGLYFGVSRQRAVAQRDVARARVEQQLARLEQVKRQIELGTADTATTDIAVTPPAGAEPASDPAADKAADAAPAEEAADSAEPQPSESSGEGSAAENTDPSTEAAAQEKVAPKKPEPSDSAELSVAPLVDDGRPAWVGRKPYKEGSVYYWPIATDPSPDTAEAEEVALPKALNIAVADYIRTRLQLGAGAARQVRLGDDYLRNEMVGEDLWIEPLSLSVGEFVRVHALMKFDRQANQIIDQQWQQQRLTGRIGSAAALLCVVLFFLALVYCYLKVDQITGGSRRGLLRIAAILVILGLMLVAAGVASAGIA
jgi:hypothetical protein